MMSYMHLPSVCAECAKLVGGKRGQRIAAKKCRKPSAPWVANGFPPVLLHGFRAGAAEVHFAYYFGTEKLRLSSWGARNLLCTTFVLNSWHFQASLRNCTRDEGRESYFFVPGEGIIFRQPPGSRAEQHSCAASSFWRPCQ